jgi:hypothetical protein
MGILKNAIEACLEFQAPRNMLQTIETRQIDVTVYVEPIRISRHVSDR